MQRLRLFFRFLKFYLRAKTRYNVHSPFVFSFTEAVLEDDRWFYAFSEVEDLRDFLRNDPTKIPITDFGAGSQISGNKERSLSSLVRYSANPPFACQYLFRIVGHYKPKTMLELGTSLAISTAYQASASLDAKFMTIEGCPNVARYALKNLEILKVKNVRLLQGRFEEMLPVALKELEKLDYLFVDGNHRMEPTLQYFGQCLAQAHEQSVFVFDDIHWSAGMEEAWDSIKNHPKVTLTIDLFFFGVVFFRKEHQVKEHYRLVPWLWKPWRIGFWDLFSK
ncbi:MAG: class I SAM-dependent methyltransferase [Bacteroidetes bacterium]|nr:class I SAM-dependent methyltransferase [Bacteroidota bacterium]